MTTYEAETPRLWLERITPKHLQDFHLLWSLPENLIWSKRLPTATLEDSKVFMQNSMYKPDAQYDKYAIILKPSVLDEKFFDPPRMIGVVGTNENEHELVYMLHRDFWSKGYMTEALTAFLKTYWELPNRKHVQTIVARIDCENWGSIKVIQRVGGRKGELTRKGYALAKDRGADGVVPEEKLRDMVAWYLDRPN